MEFDGKILKQKRKKLNKSLEEVSEVLKIRVPILKSIEENDFQKETEDFYISHYIKSYCKYLEIDHSLYDIYFAKTEHFSQLETQVKKMKSENLQKKNHKIKVHKKRNYKPLMLITIIILIIIGYFLLQNKEKPAEKKVEQPIEKPIEKPKEEPKKEIQETVKKQNITYINNTDDYYRYQIANGMNIKIVITGEVSYLGVLDHNKKELQGGMYYTGYIFEQSFENGPIILNVGAHQNAEIYINGELLKYQDAKKGRYQLELNKEN